MISRKARQGRKEPCDDYLKLPLRALRALREAFFRAVHCSDSAHPSVRPPNGSVAGRTEKYSLLKPNEGLNDFARKK